MHHGGIGITMAGKRRERRRRMRRRPPHNRTGRGLVFALGLAFLATALLIPSQPPSGSGAAAVDEWAHLTFPQTPPQAPERLQTELAGLAQQFQGRAGIAVRDVSADWTAGHDVEAPYPQQSVSKLWVALSVLDAVDSGVLRLEDPVLVRREDLSIFHQPIRELVGPDGYPTTVSALLESAATKSDNAANDVLMRLVGGPEEVRRVIADKQLGAIGLADEERYFQPAVAGLEWRPQFSFGQNFWLAREAMPQSQRQAALEAYLSAPPDGATPAAVVGALDRLASGDLLSSANTDLLLGLMASSRTGPNRLGGGLAEGWSLAHKTGTGQVMGSRATGYNDVGLLTAPDGRAYAVAVLIAETTATIPERQALMQAVTRAVIAHHQDQGPAGSMVVPATLSSEPAETAALDLRPSHLP